MAVEMNNLCATPTRAMMVSHDRVLYRRKERLVIKIMFVISEQSK